MQGGRGLPSTAMLGMPSACTPDIRVGAKSFQLAVESCATGNGGRETCIPLHHADPWKLCALDQAPRRDCKHVCIARSQAPMCCRGPTRHRIDARAAEHCGAEYINANSPNKAPGPRVTTCKSRASALKARRNNPRTPTPSRTSAQSPSVGEAVDGEAWVCGFDFRPSASRADLATRDTLMRLRASAPRLHARRADARPRPILPASARFTFASRFVQPVCAPLAPTCATLNCGSWPTAKPSARSSRAALPLRDAGKAVGLNAKGRSQEVD